MQVLGNREEQYEFELAQDATAAANRLAELREAAAEGDTEIPRATRIVVRMGQAVSEILRRHQETVTRGAGGKFKRWLRALPAEVAGVLAVRCCIKEIGQSHGVGATVQHLSTTLGSLWELEVRIREAEKVNPVYMQRVHERVKENATTNMRHLRNMYNDAYSKVMKDSIDSTPSNSERLHIGKYGIDACIEAGLIVVERGVAKNGAGVWLHIAPEVEEFLHGYTERDVSLVYDRAVGAMLCSPDDWSNAYDGGYLTPRRRLACQLVSLGKSSRKEWRAKVRDEFTAENHPELFEAANYLQSVPQRIHGPTLAVIERIWEHGGGVMGVPLQRGPVKPECPMPDGWEKAGATEAEMLTFMTWKREAVKYYLKHREWKAEVRELHGFLKSANLYDRPIWFPLHADRRGRWYYRGSPNPQGSDMSKSVLRFEEKKPLGRRGLFWLKVHIANSLGFDKERFVDRARWVEQRWEALERALDAPWDSHEVWGTDAPLSAWSAAWELREALRSGRPEYYETGLIVHMDATCSGLQHFSAMLRDPIGGRYVNLYDEAKCGPKQDIYAQVAQNALHAIARDLDSPDPDVAAMARFWSDAGIPRGLAKGPVMTYVYGATLRGTARHIEEKVAEDMPEVVFPDEARSYLYCQYAARKLFHGIETTVPAAAHAMRWLKSVAGQLAGKSMTWNSPTSFPVIHDYPAVEALRVPLRSCGVRLSLVYEMLPGTNEAKMRNAISPNFVHALDAAHLTKTALLMKGQGLAMVGIHDSFGTHACDVDAMHENIREAFIGMYEGKNLLGEFLWEVGAMGEPPQRGSLDLQQVRDSEFFFC